MSEPNAPAPAVSSLPQPRVPLPPPRSRRSILDRPSEPESTATSSSGRLNTATTTTALRITANSSRRVPRSGISENAALVGANDDVGSGVRGEATTGSGVLGVAPNGSWRRGIVDDGQRRPRIERGGDRGLRHDHAVGRRASTVIASQRPGSACARARKRASRWSSMARRRFSRSGQVTIPAGAARRYRRGGAWGTRRHAVVLREPPDPAWPESISRPFARMFRASASCGSTSTRRSRRLRRSPGRYRAEARKES